jgi:transposase-like protein
VSREFVGRTRDNLVELMNRRLDDVRLAVLMLDGIELKRRCCVVALGVTTDGVKITLGLWARIDRERHRRQGTADQPSRAGARPRPRASYV